MVDVGLSAIHPSLPSDTNRRRLVLGTSIRTFVPYPSLLSSTSSCLSHPILSITNRLLRFESVPLVHDLPLRSTLLPSIVPLSNLEVTFHTLLPLLCHGLDLSLFHDGWVPSTPLKVRNWRLLCRTTIPRERWERERDGWRWETDRDKETERERETEGDSVGEGLRDT